MSAIVKDFLVLFSDEKDNIFGGFATDGWKPGECKN
jgi:hypothetical protein